MKGTKKVVVEMFPLRVTVTRDDIEGGLPCDQNHCMQRVAITRALRAKFPGAGHVHSFHVKVAGNTVRMNHDDYRWEAFLPKAAGAMLVKYDNPKTRHLVKPHAYWLKVIKGKKIPELTRERQDQINAARDRRIAQGKPDKVTNRMTLRQRIVGMV